MNLVTPAAPAPPAVRPPASALPVPASFRAQLDEAMALGRADTKAFADQHGPEERMMIRDWSTLKLPFPPDSDDAELAVMHDIASKRTPAGDDAARYWAAVGTEEAGKEGLQQYAAVAGPEDARAAQKLLDDVLMTVNASTQLTKASALRTRPFVVDPDLPIVVRRPGNNPSYPSGHTSAAFATNLVLAHLMPDRAAEFMDTAREASWSRVYAGVHFPSDVLAGARLATTITEHLADTSGVRPVTGTTAGSAGARPLAATA